MRYSLAAAALIPAILASLAAPLAAPVRAAAASSPAKVVIVVGATHGATARYRSYADAAYAEAIKYTPNVVKVYSPNATWSKVKSAAVGASIVIYLGHGNGWPSPYAYDANYTTKDGFGLNYDSNGDGNLSDHENRYYGEPYVSTLNLAPNAIVLLHHLCYASGNSEPGGANPTVTTARQRISNYAAGFLQSNAQAVLADGHRGPVDYLRALFTTDQSIEALWRTAPGNNGHVSTFASTRTSGVRALLDPEATSSGYYRSLVTDPTLTTSMVTGVSDTSLTPKAIVVPGRAAALADSPLYADPAAAAGASPDGVSTVPAGTRLKLLAQTTATAADGSALLAVEGLDDPNLAGYMRSLDVAPRDSAAPRILAVDRGSGVVSPDGNGTADSLTLGASLSEPAAWRFRIATAAGLVLHETTGTDARPSITWDGLVDGAAAADGGYGFRVDATDGWSNLATPATGSIRVDTAAPTLDGVVPTVDATTWFSPNGDGDRDAVAFAGHVSEASTITVRVQDASDTTVRSFSTSAGAGGTSVGWDGKATDGSVVPDGTYTVRLTPRDVAGNGGSGVTRSVAVVNLLGSVTTAKGLIYPQDRDPLARGSRLGFSLTRPAFVTWTVRTMSGAIVATFRDGAETAAGPTSRMFYGVTPDGTMLPVGRYVSHVTASDGTFTVSQSVPFQMNAFSLRSSSSTATRGRAITITAVSAESLSTTPRLSIAQPGGGSWSVTMKRVGTLTYRATVTLRTGGTAGRATFKVSAYDSAGRGQRTSVTLTLK